MIPVDKLKCDCGRPAVKRDSCKSPMCARCAWLESQSGMREGYIISRVISSAPVQSRRKDWERHWMEEDPILLPEALARLDKKLKAVDTVAG